MTLYLIAFAMGFLVRWIYSQFLPDFVQDIIVTNVMLGKRVVVSIANEAIIFELVNGQIKTKRGVVDYTEDPADYIMTELFKDGEEYVDTSSKGS